MTVNSKYLRVSDAVQGNSTDIGSDDKFDNTYVPGSEQKTNKINDRNATSGGSADRNCPRSTDITEFYISTCMAAECPIRYRGRRNEVPLLECSCPSTRHVYQYNVLLNSTDLSASMYRSILSPHFISVDLKTQLQQNEVRRNYIHLSSLKLYHDETLLKGLALVSFHQFFTLLQQAQSILNAVSLRSLYPSQNEWWHTLTCFTTVIDEELHIPNKTLDYATFDSYSKEKISDLVQGLQESIKENQHILQLVLLIRYLSNGTSKLQSEFIRNLMISKLVDHTQHRHEMKDGGKDNSENQNDVEDKNEKDETNENFSRTGSRMVIITKMSDVVKVRKIDQKSRQNVVSLGDVKGSKNPVLAMSEMYLKHLLEGTLNEMTVGKDFKMHFLTHGRADFRSSGLNVIPLSPLDMNNYFYRLSTYANFPLANIVSTVRLAEAGFVYKGIGQTVECFSCGLSISEFTEDETPMNMHQRLAEVCEFLVSVGKLPYNINSTSTPVTTQAIAVTKQTEIDVPKVQSEEIHHTDHGLQNIGHATGDTLMIPTASNKDSGFGSNDSNQQGVLSSETLRTDSCDEPEEVNSNGSQQDTFGNTYTESLIAQNSTSLFAYPEMADTASAITQERRIDGISNIEPNNNNTLQTVPGRSVDDISDIDDNIFGAAKHHEFIGIKKRLESYTSWSYNNIQRPAVLVEAGFYFIGKEDIVRCFYCDIGLAEWDPNDDPWVEHARHSPECLYVRQKRGQEFIDNIQASWRQIYSPKHKQYEDYIARLNTFSNWRSDRPQRPEQLAVAGFFYTGVDDTVRCHYCDGGLRQWDDHDVPWIEHAKWFPFCKFVVKIKGLAFIEEIGQNYDEMYNSYAVGQVQENNTSNRPNNGGQQGSTENQSIVKSALKTPAAQSVLTMGFSKTKVNSAINTYIQQTENRDFKAQDILDILLKSDEESSAQGSGRSATDLDLDRVLEDVRSLDLDSIDTDRLRLMNEKLKSEIFLCKKCKSKERNMVFVPCGHRITCESCSKGMNVCLVCGGYIKRSVKTFMS